MSGETHIFGSAETTPGVATYPSVLNADTTTNPQLKIRRGVLAPPAQPTLQIVDKDGTTVLFEIGHDGHVKAFGMKLAGSPGFLQSETFLNGQQNPPCVQLANGARIWGGTGAPSASTVGTGRLGDIYLRRDTPSTANQRYYVCTVAGTPGTWQGIA